MTTAWERVRAVAYGFRDFTEQPPNSNRGQVVDRFIRAVGLDPAANGPAGWPWCLAYVYYCGWVGLYDPVTGKSTWPAKKTAGCQDLADWAKAKGILKDEPEVGDLVVVWYVFKNKVGKVTARRFGHVGFLIHKNADGTWTTLEGNTSKPGDTDPKTAREGWGVFERKRVLKPDDRFVRWIELM